MGTLIEEIFSDKAGHPVHAGDIVMLDVDYMMTHDNTSPLAIKAFREVGKPIKDINKIAVGDQINIPAPPSDVVPGASPTASVVASPSP